ncbi:hypothetical protein bpmyx0001_59250 [Bacillus pseudomycoides DSM 12442]|nr:hypothetical protein bpmyx0001_59250 [Bacillus pseudomycoides DSM 12442]
MLLGSSLLERLGLWEIEKGSMNRRLMICVCLYIEKTFYVKKH